MKINQLFKEKVSESLMISVLSAFGLKSLDDQAIFCKSDMITKYQTVININKLKPELERYYLPCKARTYLSNIDTKKALTILRQLLRLYGYILEIKQKYIKYKKVIYYKLSKENAGSDDESNIIFNNESFRITF